MYTFIGMIFVVVGIIEIFSGDSAFVWRSLTLGYILISLGHMLDLKKEIAELQLDIHAKKDSIDSIKFLDDLEKIDGDNN